MLKSAIIGCGGIAGVHAQALSSMDNVDLCAFADIIISRAEELAEKFGGNAYCSLEEMLDAEKPDILHICTPHYLHAQMTLAAKSRGIHVFLEKPPAVSRREFTTLNNAYSNGSERLGICFQNRYNGSVKHVKKLINKSIYGSVLGARAFVTWHREAPYYTGSGWRGKWKTECGGVLINQSIHTLDLLVHFLGKPVNVEASCANHHLKGLIEVEDTVEANISFSGGANALFYATTAFCTDSPVFIEIICENGRIRMEDQRVTEYSKDGSVAEFDFREEAPGKDYWGASHGHCINDFYSCIETGDKFPIEVSDISDTLRLVFGIYESSNTNQPIDL